MSCDPQPAMVHSVPGGSAAADRTGRTSTSTGASSWITATSNLRPSPISAKRGCRNIRALPSLLRSGCRSAPWPASARSSRPITTLKRVPSSPDSTSPATHCAAVTTTTGESRLPVQTCPGAWSGVGRRAPLQRGNEERRLGICVEGDAGLQACGRGCAGPCGRHAGTAQREQAREPPARRMYDLLVARHGRLNLGRFHGWPTMPQQRTS